jgi:hypothetical protein
MTRTKRNAPPVKVALSPEEREALTKAAKKEDRPLGAYLRLLFLRSLQESPVTES